MYRPNVRPAPFVAVPLLSLVCASLISCSGTAEQPLISQFFNASRLRDNTSLGNIAMVSFDPQTQGTVTSFTIQNVTPEERRPLQLRALAKAQDDARAEDASFTERKEAYQNANLEAIRRVIKNQNENAKIGGKDADVQAAWSKMLEEGASVSKKVADARRRLRSESQLVDLSINTGSQHVDITKYDGELVSKNATVAAPVRLPNGDTVQKTLVLTLQRAVLKGDKEMTGRWIVTGIRDGSGSPGTSRS